MTDTVALAPDAPDAPDAPEGKSATEDSPFRWRLLHRPDVRFGHATGGIAGLLIAAAVLGFVIGVADNDPTAPGVGFNALLVVLALIIGFRFRGPARSAAVGAIVVAVPQIWLFAIIGDGANVQRGDFRLILLLTIATYLGLYLLTWTRGRAVLLGLALFFAVTWIVFEVSKQSAPVGLGAISQAQQGTGGLNNTSGLLGTGSDKSTAIAITEAVSALVLLGMGTVLDRRRRAGAATPFLLVGSVWAVIGALSLGTDVDNVYATGAFLAVAGLLIGLAGSLGRRRGTSWFGALVLLVGAVVVVAQGTSDAGSGGSGSAATFGAFALVAAAVLLAVGELVARRLGEPVDGGEPIRAKPEPVPAAVAATPEAAVPETAVATAPDAAAPPETPPETPAADTPVIGWSSGDTAEPDAPDPAPPEA